MNKMFENLLSYFLTTLLVLNNWARIIMGFKDQSGIVFLYLYVKGVCIGHLSCLDRAFPLMIKLCILAIL